MKQIASSILIHFVNLVLSQFVNRNKHDERDECASYLIAVLFDSTFGVIFTVILLKSANRHAKRKREYSLVQGNFLLSENKIDTLAYFIQTLIWLCVCLINKILLTILYLINTDGWNAMGQVLLSPINSFNTIKLIIVVIIVPLLTNSYTFIIFDQLLKNKKPNYDLDLKLIEKVQKGELDDPEAEPEEEKQTDQSNVAQPKD